MYAISIPCHHCGHDNPANAIRCTDCQAVIRLQPTTTTQQLKPASHEETSEEGLIREAFLVSSLLLQSAYRLRALLDAKIGKQ
jgi:predicted ATP-dependent serine protease